MNKKAAVFIILGQSNAVGHGIPMEEKDILSTPLSRVFGLSREQNQSFDSTALHWSGYVSAGMNLAESQDNTYSVPNELARLWQRLCDGGAELPDLHIIQIAIGAQGVSEGYMWHPDREKKLIPGKLGTVDISLYPYSMHIFSLLEQSFAALKKDFEIMGVHWRGGEEDTENPREDLKEYLRDIYERIFDGFSEVLKAPPFVLHWMRIEELLTQNDPSGKKLHNMEEINALFEELSRHYPHSRVFDPAELSCYDPALPGKGLFIKDLVHFTPEANRQAAERILQDYIKTR